MTVRAFDEIGLVLLSTAAFVLWVGCWWRFRRLEPLAASFPGIFCILLTNFAQAISGTQWLPFFVDVLAWGTLLSGAVVVFAALSRPRSFALGPSFVVAALPGAAGVIALHFGATVSFAQTLLLVSILAGIGGFVRSVLTLFPPKARAVR